VIGRTLSPRLRTWRWRVFAATWLGYIGYYCARKPFYINKASLGEALAWDAERLGQIGAIYLVCYAAGQFISGFLGDRIGPRVLGLCGMLLTIGANAAFGFTNSWGTFAALMALNGLAQATGWPTMVGSIAPWFTRRERGTVMGFWSTNFQVGGVVANTLAAWVLGQYGYQYSFVSGSAALLLVWVFFLFNQRNRPEDVGESLPAGSEDRAPSADGAASKADGPDAGWTPQVLTNVAIVGAFYFCVKFIRYALWSWAPYLLQTRMGVEPDDAGYLSTVFDVCGIAGVIFIGFLSDRLFAGRRAGVSFLFILALVASTALLYTVGTTSVVAFTVCMGLVGLSLYGPDALMTGAGAIDVGSPRRATMAAGFINGMGSLGPIMQELVLGGVLEDAGMSAVFAALVVAALGAAAALAVLLLRGRMGKADV
jgi:sugar phosphate permease